MSGVRSGVSGRDKFVSVSSTARDCTAFSMASLAAVIKVSSSVSIALSAIVFLASVLPSFAFVHPAWQRVRSGNSS